MTFHASFRAPDISHHQASGMYTCHQNGLVTPSAIGDLIETLDQSASRFVIDSVEGFNDVSIVLSQGESIDLLARAEASEHIAAHRVVYQ